MKGGNMNEEQMKQTIEKLNNFSPEPFQDIPKQLNIEIQFAILLELKEIKTILEKNGKS